MSSHQTQSDFSFFHNPLASHPPDWADFESFCKWFPKSSKPEHWEKNIETIYNISQLPLHVMMSLLEKHKRDTEERLAAERHKKSTTPRPIVCTDCGKDFVDWAYFTKHAEQKHREHAEDILAKAYSAGQYERSKERRKNGRQEYASATVSRPTGTPNTSSSPTLYSAVNPPSTPQRASQNNDRTNMPLITTNYSPIRALPTYTNSSSSPSSGSSRMASSFTSPLSPTIAQTMFDSPVSDFVYAPGVYYNQELCETFDRFMQWNPTNNEHNAGDDNFAIPRSN